MTRADTRPASDDITKAAADRDAGLSATAVTRWRARAMRSDTSVIYPTDPCARSPGKYGDDMAERSRGKRRKQANPRRNQGQWCAEHSFLVKFVNCPGLFLQSFNWINTPFTDVATKQQLPKLLSHEYMDKWRAGNMLLYFNTLVRLFFLVCRTCGPLCIISAVLSITFSWTFTTFSCTICCTSSQG